MANCHHLHHDGAANFLDICQKTPLLNLYNVIVGVELEFYISVKSPIKKILQQYIELLQINCELFVRVIEEKGENQFEIVFKPSLDLPQVAKNVITARNLAASFFTGVIDFSAKPYKDDFGSAMHINISLHGKDDKNLFTKPVDYPETTVLLYAVAGLLSTVENYYNCFIPSIDDKSRLDGRYMAPSHLCWGKNNRTALLRVVGKDQSRRLEHRLAGSNASPWQVLTAILSGLEHGIKNKLMPPAPIFGNAYDPQYLLPELDFTR
ncbi:MAG: hypothetical protein AAF153_00815 [Pseudomonadota bacterium]